MTFGPNFEEFRPDMRFTRSVGIVAALFGALALGTGCNEKSAPSSATTGQTQTPPKMKMTTEIPEEITTPRGAWVRWTW